MTIRLGNVIVFISDGLAGRTFDVPAEAVTFEQKGCEYAPHVVALRANQKLKMVNSDNTTHNIHPLPANNREWNKAEPAGMTMEESFPREEIAIPVKCNVHPWMKSYVAVFKHPFFAVTRQGWKLPTAESATGRVHRGSVARKARNHDAKDHGRCGRDQGFGFHVQSSLGTTLRRRFLQGTRPYTNVRVSRIAGRIACDFVPGSSGRRSACFRNLS